MPWGTSSAVSTRPATRSLESHERWYVRATWSPGRKRRIAVTAPRIYLDTVCCATGSGSWPGPMAVPRDLHGDLHASSKVLAGASADRTEVEIRTRRTATWRTC